MKNIEDQVAEEGASLYIRYLVAAEQAVARGEFNNAKVLRALAYSHRAVAMQVVRAQGNAASAADMLALSRLPKDELVARSALGERLLLVIGIQAILAAHTMVALESTADVPEWVIPPFLFVCVNCGDIAFGERPETCPACGALSVEFDGFGPYYAADAEHLGRLSPARVLEILAATPGEVRELVTGMDEVVLATKPSATEWSVKEIIGHIIEVDGLFAQRVQAVLARDEYRQSLAPWKMHEGKAYDQKSAQELLDLLDAARAHSLDMVRGLTTQQWADAASMLGGRRSVLEIGTWHANHDVGHVAQMRRLLAS
ncbi:MAG: DinB family protein [Caldilineaceae bacterium]|nr:DinB family protein [Caldilineaceae bacterium]